MSKNGVRSRPSVSECFSCISNVVFIETISSIDYGQLNENQWSQLSHWDASDLFSRVKMNFSRGQLSSILSKNASKSPKITIFQPEEEFVKIYLDTKTKFAKFIKNAISPDESFHFQRFLAQKYL